MADPWVLRGIADGLNDIGRHAAANDVAAAADEIERLQQAVRDYGGHDFDTCNGLPDDCSCGLSDLLKSFPPDTSLSPQNLNEKLRTAGKAGSDD